MPADIAVVDYGIGNLFSVCRALEHCGADVVIASEPEQIIRATRVLLPGVGAFGEGMRRLSEAGLDKAITQFACNGGHLLGVCLGMQLLMDSSVEFGVVKGLGLIPGTVVPLSSESANGKEWKVPHIGWSDLQLSEGRSSWHASILEMNKIGSAMYFLHSFVAMPNRDEYRFADCMRGESRVAAVIGRGRIWGAQFHPEKSGEAGLSLLRAFLRQE